MSRWTDTELEQLKSQSKYNTAYDLAKMFNRSKQAIITKCLKLKLDYIRDIKQEYNEDLVSGDYSAEEINFIKNNYLNISNSLLARLLNRPIKSVSKKVRTLNLGGLRINKDNLYMRDDEKEFIINNWEKLSDIQLIEYINENLNPVRTRTEKTIRNIRHSLNLRRPSGGTKRKGIGLKWTEDQTEFLINNFYNSDIDELIIRLNKTESAIKNKANELGLKRIVDRGTKWTAEQTKYLKDNINILPFPKIVEHLNIPAKTIFAKIDYLNLIDEIKCKTLPEQIVYKKLEELKSKFKEQSKIYYYEESRKKHFTVDFLVNKTIVIEVQGDYFHCNPQIYPNGPINDTQKNNIKYDLKKKNKLEELGYKVIYIWEKDIKEDNKIVEKLATLLSN